MHCGRSSEPTVKRVIVCLQFAASKIQSFYSKWQYTAVYFLWEIVNCSLLDKKAGCFFLGISAVSSRAERLCYTMNVAASEPRHLRRAKR